MFYILKTLKLFVFIEVHQITKGILNLSVSVIKVATEVSYDIPQARRSPLCSAFLHLNPCSSSRILLIVKDSINSLPNSRQGPLYHSLHGWNRISLFRVKGPLGQWWDTASRLSPETNDSKPTSFSCLFSIIEISYTDGRHQSLSVLNTFFSSCVSVSGKYNLESIVMILVIELREKQMK